MKRLHEGERAMTHTTSRRSILKYAAAMGAALVLPVGVVAAGAERDSSPIGETSTEPENVRSGYLEVELDRAEANATAYLRDVMTALAKRQSVETLLSIVETADDRQELYLDFVEAFTPSK